MPKPGRFRAVSRKTRSGGHIGARLNRTKRLVMVAVAVAPGPVFLLFARGQLAKVSVFVAMVFVRPRLVITHFLVVPDVVVAVVRVINPVVMMCASRAQYRSRQGGGQDKRTDKTRLSVHL